MNLGLKTNEDLKHACITAEQEFANDIEYEKWLPNLMQHLTSVEVAGHDEFVSGVFQTRLWNSEAVSAIGQGNVDVSAVIANKEVAELLWQLKESTLPEQSTERTKFLINTWNACLNLISPHVSRTPLLKMYRVFAALQPTEFTTVAHGQKLKSLARQMGIPTVGNTHVIELHRHVLDRLTEALGPTQQPPHIDGVRRMTLPWLLYASADKEPGEETTTKISPQAGVENLIPLPADRRRRGLLAIGGSLPSIRSMIEFAKDGCTREDLKEHIRSINPKLADTSVGTNLNALIGEWGVLRASGDTLHLTQRGEALLESGSPEEVSDWLLTRILGFDHILYRLRDAPASTAELFAVLKKVNPGWTSTFAPRVLLNWLRSLGLTHLDQNGLYTLTDDGKSWTTRIHWVPQVLQISPAEKETQALGVLPTPNSNAAARPSIEELTASMSSAAAFPSKLIARLDAGLWHNERRHFAVLTGLSGAGKTLLARNYALAMWLSAADPNDGLYTLPVQPGWHDPSSLLGYVNPLASNTYARTGFLDFLLTASGDPTRPYTVVLDEMNLSHPEQYLAPLLSAMETGDSIELHTNEEEIGGVPPRIPYPNNLVLIGTVNMDETTHGLSDKILDRASVIEFWDVDVLAFPGWANCGLDTSMIKRMQDLLVGLALALRPVRLHFGWRAIGDIVGYVRSANIGAVLDETTALDHAVFSKILPKLRGEDTPRLRLAFDAAFKVVTEAKLIESSAKLAELIDDLKHTGSARFWR